MRVRFTPAVLDAPIEEGAAAAAPVCEEVPPPPGMPAPGVRVEVQRRLGWGVLRRAIAGGLPPEVALLAAATADLPIPITLAGAPLPRPPSPSPLVRVPFTRRGATRAAREVLPAGRGAPTVEYLEHGVRLLEEAWNLAPGFPAAPFHGVELPVRVVVDAEELPTNASRSALREDAPLRGLLRDAAGAALADALRGLAAAACGVGEVPEGVLVLEPRGERLDDALGAFACVITGAARAGAELTEAAQAVLKLPLLRDGLGRPHSPASLDGRGEEPLYVWRGKEALPEELEPWGRGMVWLRGRVVDQLLTDLPWGDADEIIERARLGAARRKVLLAHAPGEPVVPPAPGHLLRVAFDVREGPWAGLRGEVAVSAEQGGARHPAAARVFVEGRHLETVPLDPAVVPWPLEAALEWEDRVRPRFSYEGVEQDDRFRSAVGYAVLVALLAADKEATRVWGGEPATPKPPGVEDQVPGKAPREGHAAPDVGRLRPLLRGAIGTLLAAPAQLGVTAAYGPGELSPAAFKGLNRALIWPTTEVGRFESLAGLSARAAQRSRALCVAPPSAQGRAADGRPVLAMEPLELTWLRAAIPDCELVPYERALWTAAGLAGRQEARKGALLEALARVEPRAGEPGRPVLAISRPRLFALATPADAHVEVWHHAGRPLGSAQGKPELAPIAVALDHDAVTPSRDWTEILSGRSPGEVALIERDLCEAIVAALEGDPAARVRLGIGEAAEEPSTRVTGYLLGAAQSLARQGKRPTAARWDRWVLDLEPRIRKLPLVAMLDAGGAPALASLAEIEAAHPAPAPIPVLEAAPLFETFGWQPVLVRDARERDAFLRWAGGRATLASPELEERRRIAVAAEEHRAFMAGPEQDPRALGDLADPVHAAAARLPPTVFLDAEGDASGGISVAAALPRAGAPVEHAWIDVLFRRRALCRRVLPLAIPVVARVNVTDPPHVLDLADLSPDGLGRVTDRVHAAAVALASRILTEAGLPGRSAAFHGEPRALALLAALLAPLRDGAVAPADLARGRVLALATSLRADALLWPTVQGEERPLGQLVTGREIRFGRQRHAPWRAGPRPADLDAPVLLLPPEGAAAAHALALLGALDLTARDVTPAIEALQLRRAGGDPAEPPRLPGAPAHPRLRVTLADLGVHEAEGEVEIIEGPASEVTLVNVVGVARPFPAEIAVPFRILFRVDSVEPTRDAVHALLKKIAKAGGRHLISLVPLLNELPPFARAHLRWAVCKTAAAGKRVVLKALKAPLFADTDGAWHSLERLREDPAAEWWCTHAPPPYPRRRYSRPVLRLTEAERGALAAILPALKDITPTLARDRAGEERAAAPPRAVIALDPELRARCFQVIPFEEPARADGAPGAMGEVGLLLQGHARDRRIAVHVTGRPLCALEAGEGWPLCAAINDDALRPNRAFDGLRTSAAAQRLRERVREVATRWLRSGIAPPADALASRWIDTSHGREQALHVTGALWLPAAWPRAPRVLVSAPRAAAGSGAAPGGWGAAPRALSTRIGHAGGHVSGLVPVEGALLVWPEGRWAEIAAVALRAVASMVAEAATARPGDAAVQAYQWNLRLLGAAEGGAPHATVATGDPVGPSQVLAELAARGCLWMTSRRGSVEGRFPDSPPPFVLLDDGAPLLEVLRHRASPGVLRELGGVDEPAPEPESPPPPHVAADRALFAAPSAPSPEPARPDEIAPAGPAPEEGPRAWMGELWRTIRSLLGAPAPPPASPADAGESELASAVHQALLSLGLAGQPIDEVIESRSGRPVRYEAGKRRVVLNPHHAALRWLKARGPADPGAIALLTAAAVGEINRALKQVTDAEERRAIDQLLGSMD